MFRHFVLAAIVCLFTSTAQAQMAYVAMPVTDVEQRDGDGVAVRAGQLLTMGTRVVLDGGGEAYLSADRRELLLAAPEAREVTGLVLVPARGGEPTGQRLAFRVSADRFTTDDADVRARFHTAKFQHYENRGRRDLPGAAWFRHRAAQALAQLSEDDQRRLGDRRDQAWLRQQGELDELALFTGGRAVAENLALDRALPTPDDADATVALDSLRGITTPEIDWTDLLDEQPADLDPLASLVPHDQHVVFFRSVESFHATLGAVQQQLMPVMEWTEQGTGSGTVLEVYQQQLLDGVPLDGVGEIALTGSDPYYRTGTDVALLLRTANPQQVVDAARPTHDRTRVAVVGEAVVVTNSEAQLRRLQAVAAGDLASLASLDEYRFFRQRYARDGGDETALLVITDATVRRWCGPRWRIASARRTRALSQLAERQAHQMTQPDPQLIHDEQWGSLAFLTPIAELSFDKVTPHEAEAYNRWREGYERGWRTVFDPIAMQWFIHEGQVSTDLTVMPLSDVTTYQQWIDIAGQATIGPRAGDPHDGTLLHHVMAIDTQGQQMTGWGHMVRGMLNMQFDPWSWIDQTVALYIERDPIWEQMLEAATDNPDAMDEWLMTNLNRIPIALHVDVKSPARLVAFLAGLRVFIEQSAPGMVTFNTRNHAEQGYIEIAVRDVGIGDIEPRIYYLASNKALVVSLSESLIHRTIDRHAAPQPADAAEPPSPWLGDQMAVTFESDVFQWLSRMQGSTFQEMARQRVWDTLPILNEWRAIAPGEDPVALHRRLWRQDLGGSEAFRWNPHWRTMESVAFGHPGEPRTPETFIGPELLRSIERGRFGVSFEFDGLRAKAQLHMREP